MNIRACFGFLLSLLLAAPVLADSASTDRISGTLTSASIKPPCVAVATTNITLSGLQTLGGVTVATGDRVLVTAQSSPIDNGIYIANTSDWQRSADFDGPRDAVNGTLVVVPAGGGIGLFYQVSGTNPIIPGTSPILFVPRDNPNLTYPQTAAEIAASDTIANYAYPAGIVDRYGVNASPGTTPMNAAVQAAVSQMLHGGQPVRYLAGAYLHTAGITFGSTNTNMFPIDIGGAGNLTQVLNANPSNTPTFDLTGRSGSYVHDLLLTGSSANKNDGIRIGTNGTGGSTRMRIVNITGFMAGHLIYGAYCNTIILENIVSWPDNGSTLIQVAQSIPTPADVLDHVYFEGDFAHDIIIRGGSLMPNTSYSSTGNSPGGGNRGIKVVSSQAYNFRIYDTLVQGENGLNSLIGIQLGGASSDVEGAIVQGVYHENSLLQFNNVNRSKISANTNGAAGGGMVVQINSTNNDIEGNSELGGAALTFDSSSIGNRYDAGFSTVTDSGSPLNTRNANNTPSVGGVLNNTLTYSTSMTPNVAAGKRIRIVIPNGHTSEAATLNNPTNLTVGDIIQVQIINATGGAMGTFTFGSMYKLASATPTMPVDTKQRCWVLAYDGTNLTVVGNEPSADTGF